MIAPMQPPIQIELPTPFMVGPVNTFLLKEPEPILIDCGLKVPICQEALVTGLAEHGLQLSDIRRIVITHAHVDHMGTAGWICEQGDAEIWVSDLVYAWAVDIKEKWEERVAFMSGIMAKTGLSAEDQANVLRYFRSVPALWDSVPAERVRTFALDGKLEMGGGSWEVLHLPGHATHQTGFWNAENGWLFSADCLLPRTPVPVIEFDIDDPTKRSLGLPLHLDSLARLAALPVNCVLPGHGEPFSNHHALITKQTARIHERKEQCYALVAAGVETLPLLTDKMYGHYPAAGRFTGLSTIIGYLDLLRAETRVRESEIDGIWHYTAFS
jgi:glyoxylase-like metal-dependent hydrolase (beta-lactamase superfamily II)